MQKERGLKDEQENYQFIDELNNFDNEKELSNNIGQNTEIILFNEENKKERHKKPRIRKKLISKKFIKKTPKKLTKKKPEIKKQKIGKKPKSKKPYKPIGKRNKKKLDTKSKELCSMGGENNTLPNSFCQKVFFYQEDNDCMDINKTDKVRFLESGGIVLVKKYIEFKNKNENIEKSLKKDNIDESWPLKNESRKEVSSNHQEIEKANANTEQKFNVKIFEEENSISNYGLAIIEENNANEVNELSSNVGESNFIHLENGNEEFNYFDDIDYLIPPNDEDLNIGLINSLYNQK